MGGFIEYDEFDPLGWGEVMRVKVLLDLNKPLRRGIKIATGQNASKWVAIKYERLMEFCYYCGRSKHVERDSMFFSEENAAKAEIVYKYGLRGSPRKRPKTFVADSEKEKALLSRLKGKEIVPRPSYEDPNVVKLGPLKAARKLQFSSPCITLVGGNGEGETMEESATRVLKEINKIVQGGNKKQQGDKSREVGLPVKTQENKV
uniref:Zinc knuckle CX2CX4HX4C domain-containing protein n=1 Tax=Chenopodium quinoa TaxID=63459 RepID=A0A803KQZ7_CHEQI